MMTLEEKLCEKATLNNIPISANFELSPICNMDCEMCFVKLSQQYMEIHGGLKKAEQWLQLAKEMADLGTMFILLTGGEPFLFPNFELLYTQLRKMGMIVTINSNGTVIDEKIVSILEKNKPRRVNITLYGTSDETYNRLCKNPKGFTQTMHGIQLLKDRGIDIKLNSSITTLNILELEEILKLADKLELPIEIDTYMFPIFRKNIRKFNYDVRLKPEDAAKAELLIKKYQLSEDGFKLYKENMRKLFDKGKTDELKNVYISCRAARSSLWVNWMGEMQPCFVMENNKFDVFNMKFKESWRLLNEQTKNIVISQECSKCEYRFICNSCAGRLYSENGSFNKAADYLCKYTKTIMEELL